MIPIAFRFDDPSPVSDRVLETEILRCFERHRAPLTVAVIPFQRVSGELVALGSEQVSHIARLLRTGLVEVALHGYVHDECSRTPHGDPSEFWGVPLPQQLHLLGVGRDRLAAVFDSSPKGFVPPWNTFDENTIRAARAVGFDYISAARHLPRVADADAVLVPISCNVSHVKRAVAEAERFAPLRPVIVAVLHHYDFKESGSQNFRMDLHLLDRMLEWLTTHPGLSVSTVSHLAGQIPPAGWRRGATRWRIRNMMHWRIQQRIPGNCLLTGRIAGAIGLVVR